MIFKAKEFMLTKKIQKKKKSIHILEDGASALTYNFDMEDTQVCRNSLVAPNMTFLKSENSLKF